MICFICHERISGAYLCYGPKDLPHHLHCTPEVITAASEVCVKPHNVQAYEKEFVENPDSVIEENIIGEVNED